MIEEARRELPGDVARTPDWEPGFRVGDAVRILDGGAYERGEVVEVAEKPRYYKVDYGFRVPGLYPRGEPRAVRRKRSPLQTAQELRPSDATAVRVGLPMIVRRSRKARKSEMKTRGSARGSKPRAAGVKE